ncbi:glycosyltransferase family 4 protein [Proteiniborus sp. MB09-C3]|uniref:glycosyltransferase family 4 protein n=1 Tax=Proteiniborus sp. MB09-C3 TaxID=3050072 RepID=UPI0025528558|nr:glycosyltransferase family 4 protein [Proteiniborus sp. MB09-C3]WIV12118.1 glycosyltransferase family 4 protein [Proteiniborus sp. MB09-C3]
MNILFLTISSMNNLDGNGLYIDLINELKDRENNVYIVCPNEKRNGKRTVNEKREKVSVLRVRTGNITKTNFIEKGISTILIESQFIKAIKTYFNNVKFDIVLYTTPPVTFEKVIKYIKNRDNCLSYLILKDIFPQNAVDLEIMKRNSFIFRFFRLKEKKLYAISDFIGCTSKGNINYIINHNPEVSPSKVELFPNSIRPRKIENRVFEGKEMREKYNIPKDAIVFVYGGNIGKPQGIEFIKEVLKKANEYKDLFIMILGSGTDFSKLSKFISDSNFKNVNILNAIPQEEYWEFLTSCDVGLIFLDGRFTVPNTPARLTYYMESALPILAATDKTTDVKDILTKAKCGYWVESGDIDSYFNYVDLLIKNKKLRNNLGINGRMYLENNYTIDKNYMTLIKHIEDRRVKNV